jgi:hypothetical protein
VSAEAQRAHLAGVLDAMGRLRVHESAEGTRLAHVGISSANVPLLDHYARLTGVGVTLVRRDYGRVGCATHCDKPHMHVLSETGRWQLVGARAAVVLAAVRPYLVTLGPEADAVLAATAGAASKPATRRAMAELGWIE